MNVVKMLLQNNLSKKLAVGGLLLIIAAFFFMFGGMQVSELERMKITDASNEFISYFEEIQSEKGNGIDQYILYSLTYSYNQNDVPNLTSREIKNFVKSTFNIDLSEDKITGNGVSPLLLEKHVSFDPAKKMYSIDTNYYSQTEIANLPIYKYQVQKIQKKSGGRFVVQYKKYKVENPYDILNYYGDTAGGTSNRIDTSKILNYLTAKGKIIDIKLACNDEILKKYGKEEGKVTIVYKIHDNNLQIINLK